MKFIVTRGQSKSGKITQKKKLVAPKFSLVTVQTKIFLLISGFAYVSAMDKGVRQAAPRAAASRVRARPSKRPRGQPSIVGGAEQTLGRRWRWAIEGTSSGRRIFPSAAAVLLRVVLAQMRAPARPRDKRKRARQGARSRRRTRATATPRYLTPPLAFAAGTMPAGRNDRAHTH